MKFKLNTHEAYAMGDHFGIFGSRHFGPFYFYVGWGRGTDTLHRHYFELGRR